ncbi:MAG: twin-arginine translocase TatA/TatE family subunit [Dehalococcoidia bacterium]
MNFINIGILEILVIVVLAFLLFGPQRLLTLASALRKAAAEFQRSASDMASAALDEHDTSASSTPHSSEEEQTEFVRDIPPDGNRSGESGSEGRRPDEFRGGN